MASLNLNEKRIYWSENGSPRKMYIGKCSQRVGREILRHVEALLDTKGTALPPPGDTVTWLREVAEPRLREKFVAAGLIEGRLLEHTVATLGGFADAYVQSRTDLRPSTFRQLSQAKDLLIEYFGATRDMASITKGERQEFRRWLERVQAPRSKRPRSANTVRRLCGRCKQLFAAAMDKEAIARNPFAGMADMQVKGNRSRHFMMNAELDEQVLAAMPDAKWRLIFAFARYGGFRMPSEINRLTWEHIKWDKGVMIVPTPKTERDPDQSQKEVPIFEKLWPHLEAMKRDPAADPVFVVAHPRNEKGEITNLSQQFHRHLKRAGIKAWPKLFQNLRSTRQTEVAAVFDEALACRWLGNSPMVFRKHYLQVSPDVIERATGRTRNVRDEREDGEGGQSARMPDQPSPPHNGPLGEKSGDARAGAGRREQAGRNPAGAFSTGNTAPCHNPPRCAPPSETLKVPERGLEPPPSYLDKNLNLARLPIPPLGRVDH